jgi:NAD(P)H-hydrate repair Nnr-like enzyme with NAD(P)H-hydrate dehydratase domain
VAGCGGGKAIAEALPALLHGAPALVLDADALNAMSREPSLWARLQARRSHGQLTVLTPHPLEAARLLGLTTAEIQHDRIAAAQRLADQAGAVVVLKGSGSIVAAPGLLPWVNASGNARLATGGTGDVLAGWIGGAWSSAGPHAPRSQAGFTQALAALHQLVAACVHLHGLAAQRCADEQTLPATAVLPASALVDQMALQLVRAAHGHQG